MTTLEEILMRLTYFMQFLSLGALEGAQINGEEPMGSSLIYVGGPKKNRTGFGELFLIVVECSPARWV